MKILFLAFNALLLGVGLGVGFSWLELGGTENSRSTRGTSTGTTMDPVARCKAVIVGSDTHDFGVMERNSVRSHTFRIRNEGQRDLVLSDLRSTCKCTSQTLSHEVIQPGETAEMFVEWKPTDYAVFFQQYASVHTTDPDNPVVKFSIIGRVDQTVRPVPETINFGDISASDSRNGTMRVYCYRDREFEIVSAELTENDSANHYDISLRPMTEEELASESMAKSGYLVTITIEPGLPLGPLHQAILLKTNLDNASEIQTACRGRVVSDISLYGDSRFSDENNFLDLGVIDGSQGIVYRMYLTIKGPHREGIGIEPGPIDPTDLLQVTVGPPELGERIVRYALDICVPAGSPPANHFGSQEGRLGKIVLETTHPQASQVSLYVRFAVE